MSDLIPTDKNAPRPHLQKGTSNHIVDYKLATGKGGSFPPEAMKNGDITDIMDEWATMEQPPDSLESSIPESTLHRISKKIKKEAIEDKKV